jgi:hypothetical protein
MKTRSVLAVLVATALASGTIHSTAAAAEVTDAQRETLQLKMDELRSRLALTPEQEAQLAPLVQARNDKLKALRASSSSDPSRRERRGMLRQARSIQQDFIKQVAPLITKEQAREWDAIRKEMREAAMAQRQNR